MAQLVELKIVTADAAQVASDYRARGFQPVEGDGSVIVVGMVPDEIEQGRKRHAA